MLKLQMTFHDGKANTTQRPLVGEVLLESAAHRRCGLIGFPVTTDSETRSKRREGFLARKTEMYPNRNSFSVERLITPGADILLASKVQWALLSHTVQKG